MSRGRRRAPASAPPRKEGRDTGFDLDGIHDRLQLSLVLGRHTCLVTSLNHHPNTLDIEDPEAPPIAGALSVDRAFQGTASNALGSVRRHLQFGVFPGEPGEPYVDGDRYLEEWMAKAGRRVDARWPARAHEGATSGQSEPVSFVLVLT